MPEPKAAPSTLNSAFARKVRASRWALLFERLWPRVWVLIGLGGFFLLVSLAGVWALLSDAAHLALLVAFAAAAIAALLFAVRVPFPSREEAVRRIERVSGVPHRPASSYEDTITANADDPRTAAIWQAHRSRLAAALSRLRVGKPHPRTDRQDPIALRGLLVLGVVALLALVGDSVSDRLRSAFRFNSAVALSEARLDAWVAPPSYTGRPPLMLADGSRPNAPPPPAGKLYEVPEHSMLIVRATGRGIGALSLDVLAENATSRKRVEAKQPEAGKSSATNSNVSEVRFEMRTSAEVRVMAGGSELARWSFYVTPDKAPKIAMSKQPERTRRGSLKLTYKVEDDYGVVAAGATVKKAPTQTTDKPGRPGHGVGARPGADGPPPAARASARDHAAPAARLAEGGADLHRLWAASLCRARGHHDARGQGCRRQHRPQQAHQARPAAASLRKAVGARRHRAARQAAG